VFTPVQYQQFSIQNLTLQGKDAVDFRKVTKE
jgi:hypothetical protein